MFLEHFLADHTADQRKDNGSGNHQDQHLNRRHGFQRIAEIRTHTTLQSVGKIVVAHDPDGKKAAQQILRKDYIA